MDEYWKQFADSKKLVTEDHIIYDPIYNKFPEEAEFIDRK